MQAVWYIYIYISMHSSILESQVLMTRVLLEEYIPVTSSFLSIPSLSTHLNCVQVEAEVSPTSSDHLQSVVINKNRDNRHEQEQYPSLPHQQQQQQPLVLVSKKPNRGG